MFAHISSLCQLCVQGMLIPTIYEKIFCQYCSSVFPALHGFAGRCPVFKRYSGEAGEP